MYMKLISIFISTFHIKYTFKKITSKVYLNGTLMSNVKTEEHSGKINIRSDSLLFVISLFFLMVEQK